MLEAHHEEERGRLPRILGRSHIWHEHQSSLQATALETACRRSLAPRRWSLPEHSQVLRSRTADPTVEMVVTLGEAQKPVWRWTVTAIAMVTSIGVRAARIVK